MLSETLSEFEPEGRYTKLSSSSIFIGVKIKNLYDEKRIQINKKYKPKRIKIDDVNLYGVIKEPEHTFQKIVKDIEVVKNFDLIGYSNFLEKYNLSCDECYNDLTNQIYPIDSKYINTIIPDYSFNNFIIQQEEIPFFQLLTPINLFIISSINN